MDALVIARKQESVLAARVGHGSSGDCAQLGMDVSRIWAWMLW